MSEPMTKELSLQIELFGKAFEQLLDDARAVPRLRAEVDRLRAELADLNTARSFDLAQQLQEIGRVTVERDSARAEAAALREALTDALDTIKCIEPHCPLGGSDVERWIPETREKAAKALDGTATTALLAELTRLREENERLLPFKPNDRDDMVVVDREYFNQLVSDRQRLRARAGEREEPNG